MRTLGQSFGVAGELFGVAQETRVDEIENRPQVAQVILDRRPGQRDPIALFRSMLAEANLLADDEADELEKSVRNQVKAALSAETPPALQTEACVYSGWKQGRFGLERTGSSTL